MTCPSCGTANSTGARFCVECGAALALACPTCGAEVAVGQRFCANCGTALGRASAPAPAPAASPVAERRVCSVLFCDLVGSTSLAESRDPESVRELLGRYFEAARLVVDRHGGTIEKFIGDAVMAVWGAPVATEDDAERAVRAALELADTVAELGAASRIPSLSARAGIVTAEVAVTVGAVGQGLVAGDPVNTAARVQSAADPGAVLVDDATAARIRDAVQIADAGEHAMKGKAAPQHLWRAVRVLANVGGAQRVDGLEAPLTGREVELRIVKDLFHATVDRRAGRLVLIIGDAGSGKSRLGWEFEKYTDGLADPVWWHRSRCLSYGDGIAYWAVAGMVRQRLGIAEEDPPEIALPLFTEGLERHVRDDAERDFIAIRLGRLLGLDVEGDDGRDVPQADLFAGWTAWLLRLAAEQPVVWLIEDLHHADPALLAFLEHLLDRTRTAAVHVLALARPEIEELEPGWSTGRHRQRVALEPLDEPSMRRLLGRLVEGLPDAAAVKIAERAQGVPLFAVETVRSLIDRDVVQARQGLYRLVGELGDLQVPDSLRGLLAARLDQLPAAQRSLVADASVLGDTFTTDGLAAVSGRSGDGLAGDLDALTRRELFVVRADPLSPEVGSLAFAHELLRRVAYETLSRRDRKSRHLLVADHLRRAFPNDGAEVTEVVGRHLLDAAAAVEDAPDAEGLRAAAVAMYVRAAERSTELGAHARAATEFEVAAENTPGTDAAPLWERATVAAGNAVLVDAAARFHDRAVELYSVHGETRSAARTAVVLGTALLRAFRYDEARVHIEPAVAMLADPVDIESVRAAVALARLEVFSHSEAAERASRQALTLGQQVDPPDDVMADLLSMRGVFHSYEGRSAEAIAYLERAAVHGEHSGNSLSTGLALMNLAAELVVRDSAAGRSAAESALGHLRRVGLRRVISIALENLTDAQIRTGFWDECSSTLDRARADEELEGPIAEWMQARLAALRGHRDDAMRDIDRMAEDAGDDAELRSAVDYLQALVADSDGRHDRALRFANTAAEAAADVGINSTQTSFAWVLAARGAATIGDLKEVRRLLLWLGAQTTGALVPLLRAERRLVEVKLAAAEGGAVEAEFAAAIAGIRKDSTPWHLAQALLDQAEYLDARGEDGSAAVLEAIEIAERLGAEPVLRRARASAAALSGA